MPARIHAAPLEDVNAITFLGAPDRPEARGRAASGSSARRRRSRSTRSRPVSSRTASVGSIRLESIYPIVQGYKDFAAVGVRANFSDPLYLNRASLTASYTPDGDLPEHERCHVEGELAALRLDARLPGERRRLLRPVRAHEDEPQGLGRRPRLQPQPRSTTCRAGSTSRPTSPTTATSTACPTTRAIADELHRRARDTRAAALRGLPPLARLRGRGEGARLGGRLRWATASRATSSRSSTRTSTSAWRCRCRTPRCGCAAAGWGPGDERHEPFANFYFGGFGNNWVDHRDEKRYRESDSFPGLEINEVGGTNYGARDGRVEPAAAALPRGGHAELLPHVAAARALRERARHERGRRRVSGARSATPAPSSTSASACSRGSS